jgi:hypothetical protein
MPKNVSSAKAAPAIGHYSAATTCSAISGLNAVARHMMEAPGIRPVSELSPDELADRIAFVEIVSQLSPEQLDRAIEILKELHALDKASPA